MESTPKDEETKSDQKPVEKEEESKAEPPASLIQSNFDEKHRKMVLEVDVSMEIRKKLWDGQIPLKITLDVNDVNHMQRPRSLYVMAPRLNYLFFILNEVKQNFDEYGPADKLDSYNDMWFEGPDRKPLKWSVPLGVQFDAIAGLEGRNKDLPWELIFHYKSYPEEFKEQKENLTMQNYFKHHFFNSLKEAQVVRAGSAQEILSSQSTKDTQRMMEGLTMHNFDAFWEINQSLCNRPLKETKKFALRIYSNECPTCIQPHLPVPREEGEKGEDRDQELGELLVQAFPQLFAQEVNEELEAEVKTVPPNLLVLCQGVEADLKTPMHWMQLNLAHLDNFVYLSLHFT